MAVPITPDPRRSARAKRVEAAAEMLRHHIFTVVTTLDVEAWHTPEPVTFDRRMSGRRINPKVGDSWGALWDCAWFHFTGTVPEEAAGKEIVLLLDLGGEGCVFSDEGEPVQGLTNIRSGFDYSLGRPGKKVYRMADTVLPGSLVDLWVDAACNDLFGSLSTGGVLHEAAIATCRHDIEALVYDFEVLRELYEQLPTDSARAARILLALYDAALVASTSLEPDSIAKARSIVGVELARRNQDAPLTITAVGHAHIDLAWLWPLRETYRKGARTFSTVLRMMERYPEYVFGASQPQLYQWMKDQYPGLYAQIKQRVAEGRWELQGGMWVEPDANMPSGEALVRQLLYGIRFYRQEFGTTVDNLWMPDVFGYSGNLPQIMQAAGLKFFLTQKLSWNDVNTHPHHTFIWEGIDGSRVLVHMPPEATYNSSAAPRAMAKAEREFVEKDLQDACLVLFGIGDGGGGPGEEHLERLKRERNLQGLPPVVQQPASKFFEHISASTERLAVWHGELYLERHQGTLTTHAANKRWNRRMEDALRTLEISAVRAHNTGAEYPTRELENIWKEILLYQFHDILPGSSIARVYRETDERYATLYNRVHELTKVADEAWAVDKTRAGKTVCNSLSWPRCEWQKVDETWHLLKAPPLAAVALDTDSCDIPDVTAKSSLLQNDMLRVEFNAEGEITSIYDTRAQREVLRKGELGNQLHDYDDQGDAWDFASDYRSAPSRSPKIVETSAEVDGPCAIMNQVRTVGDSTIKQRIILTAGSARLDFHTEVDWRENGRMLRASFPVAVFAETARCEIQFGHIHRPTTSNTSWEMAREEICAHRWIDLSQPDYGVALLNDCKYGHYVKDCILDIDLLRSPNYPDSTADRCSHQFTYSLLPHTGDHIAAGVLHEAHQLNTPLRIIDFAAREAAAEPYVEIDTAEVVLEAVKKAEDDSAQILRLYEAWGASCTAVVHLPGGVTEVCVVNLLEETIESVPVTNGTVTLAFRPFEIKSLKVVLA